METQGRGPSFGGLVLYFVVGMGFLSGAWEWLEQLGAGEVLRGRIILASVRGMVIGAVMSFVWLGLGSLGGVRHTKDE